MPSLSSKSSSKSSSSLKKGSSSSFNFELLPDDDFFRSFLSRRRCVSLFCLDGPSFLFHQAWVLIGCITIVTSLRFRWDSHAGRYKAPWSLQLLGPYCFFAALSPFFVSFSFCLIFRLGFGFLFPNCEDDFSKLLTQVAG